MTTKKRHALKNLVIEKVAVVANPAHEGALITIAKSKDQQAPAAKAKDGDDAMTADEIKALNDKVAKAEADKATADAAKAAAEKRAERAEKVAGLPAPELALLKSLPAEKQDAFLALDAAGRAVEVAKANDADPVVYKSPRTGREFRKSADPALVEAVRTNDELAAEVAKSRDREAESLLKARAASECSHLPGAEQVRVDLLRAIDTIKDDARRAEVQKAIKAGNDAIAAAFGRSGSSATPTAVSGSPEAQLESLVVAEMAKSKVGRPAALAVVCATNEGDALYRKIDEKARKAD